MEKNCSAPDCDNDVSHSFGFPGEALQFICEEHRQGRDALASADFTKVAKFAPIAEFVDSTPHAELLCTHKAHNAKHVRPAVLAYSWHGEQEGQPPVQEPGVACPGCVIEIVRLTQTMQGDGWRVELAELP